MKRIKLALVLGLGGLVSACGQANLATRAAPYEITPAPVSAQPADPVVAQPAATALDLPEHALAAAPTGLSVDGITIRVPRSLKVSEANRYLPRGDIVWREDPIGDRHRQVAAIFETAMSRGTESLNGVRPVALDIEVKRFHALTEKARHTVGGVHVITFDLILKDPETGEALTQPREIRADLDAFGGAQALRAEMAGQTQKVRITNHLAEVIRQELSNAKGYKNSNLGIIQAIHAG